jgi:hypothetical protein
MDKLSPQVEEADRLLDQKPSSLGRWLQAEKLEFADADPRPHWGSTLSHLRATGNKVPALAWIESQADELVRRWGVTKRKRCAKDLCRRFVRAKFDRLGIRNVKPTPIAEYEKDIDVLPDYLKWTLLHPGLCPEDAKDPRVELEVAAYVKANPPSQAALNHFNHCKADKAARQKMFDEVKAILLEERKKKKAPIGEQDQREVERIKDMRAELSKLSSKSA